MTAPNTTATLRVLVCCNGYVRTTIGAWGCDGVRESIRRLWHQKLVYRKSPGRYWPTHAGWAALAYDDQLNKHEENTHAQG